jgi:hypothetical protein
MEEKLLTSEIDDFLLDLCFEVRWELLYFTAHLCVKWS